MDEEGIQKTDPMALCARLAEETGYFIMAVRKLIQTRADMEAAASIGDQVSYGLFESRLRRGQNLVKENADIVAAYVEKVVERTEKV